MPSGEEVEFVFDAYDELARLLLFDLPALALVLHLMAKKSAKAADALRGPGPRDGALAFAVFLALALVATASGAAASLFPDSGSAGYLERPFGAAAWITAFLSCAATGYLEEAYFRAYLPESFDEAGVPPPRAMIASTVLFAVCHLYEGPWGVLNACLAGGILSAAYLYRKSVHAPAWAHAAYNFFVYATAP